jgi:hypothetical protein
MSVVVGLSARETFTPRELAATRENMMRMVPYDDRGVDPNARRPQTPVRREQGAKPPPKTEGTEGRPHKPTAPAAIGRAYERFLELPVPVVLVVLWLFGALILGAVVMGVYSFAVWPSAAIAPP